MPTVEPSSTAYTNNSTAKITQQLVVLKKLQASTALEEIHASLNRARNLVAGIQVLDLAILNYSHFQFSDDELNRAFTAADQLSKPDSKAEAITSEQLEAKSLINEIRLEFDALGKLKIKKIKELIDYYFKKIPRANLEKLNLLDHLVKNLILYVKNQNSFDDNYRKVKRLIFVLDQLTLKVKDAIIARKILEELNPKNGESLSDMSIRFAAQKNKIALINDELLRAQIIKEIDDKIVKLPSPIAKPNSDGAAATTATVAPSAKAANRPRAATDTSAQRRTPSDVTASWRTKHVQRFVALNYGSPLHVPMNPVREKELKDVSKQDNKFMLPVLHLS